jgi:hypothetical protein
MVLSAWSIGMKLARATLLLLTGCLLLASCETGFPTASPMTEAGPGAQISASDAVAPQSDTTVVPAAPDTTVTERGGGYIGAGGD